MRSDYVGPDMLGHVLAALTPENALALEVAAHTGLRISDVLSIESDRLAPRMYVRESKTGKSRRISLSKQLLDRMYALKGRKFVFEGRLDWRKHRTRQAVYKDLTRAARAFRCDVNLTPHSTRKLYAVESYHQSGDMAKVQKLLNHDDPAVTALYAMADLLTARRFPDRVPS